jgi:hypothetical protein
MLENQLTWSLSIIASFPSNVSRGYCVMKDLVDIPRFIDPVTFEERDYRFVDSNRADFSAFKVFESYRNFLTALGYTVGAYRNVDIISYGFRFQALTTNDEIIVLGSNDDLSPTFISNNQSTAIETLHNDYHFNALFTQIAGWL